MTPNDVVSHKDFSNLVRFAWRKYKIADKHPQLEYDDFLQNVAWHILKYGIEPTNQISTNVIQHCLWSLKKKRPVKRKAYYVPLSYKDRHQQDLENSDYLQVMLPKLTKKQKVVVNLLNEGYTQAQISDQLRCSRQNVECLLRSAAKRLNRYEAQRDT
jgi:hypothetical protein